MYSEMHQVCWWTRLQLRGFGEPLVLVNGWLYREDAKQEEPTLFCRRKELRHIGLVRTVGTY